MIKLICDRCKHETDPRKSFIFSAEKCGVRLTDAKVEKVELGDECLYSYPEGHLVDRLQLHHKEKLLCSKCMMDLWNQL